MYACAIAEQLSGSLADEAQVATGIVPLLSSVGLNIGADYYNEKAIRSRADTIIARGQRPVWWLTPDYNHLDAGKVDFLGLKDHPHYKTSIKLINEYTGGSIVRIGMEVTNYAGMDKTKRRWISPENYYDNFWKPTVKQLAPGNLVDFGIEPSGGMGFEEWVPKEVKSGEILTHMSVSVYGDQCWVPSTPRGQTTDAFWKFANSIGQLAGCLEGGSTSGDILNGNDRLEKYYKPMMAAVLAYNLRTLYISNDPFGGYAKIGWKSSRWAPGIGLPPGSPPWPGSPVVVDFLKNKLLHPLFIKAMPNFFTTIQVPGTPTVID